MPLSAKDQYFIAWYRSLRAYDRLIIYGWLLTGDTRLIVNLRGRVVHSQPDKRLEVAAPEGR